MQDKLQDLESARVTMDQQATELEAQVHIRMSFYEIVVFPEFDFDFDANCRAMNSKAKKCISNN